MKLYMVSVFSPEEHRSVERLYLFTTQRAAIKFAAEERKKNSKAVSNFQIANSDTGVVAHAAYWDY